MSLLSAYPLLFPPVASLLIALRSRFNKGVIAQLVERLNGIEEVWGSNPHGSTIVINSDFQTINVATFLNMKSPLVYLFLITLFSAVSLNASTDKGESRDQFNFSSLVARSGQRIVTSLSDFPDEISPVSVKDEENENDPDTGLGMVIQEYSIAQTEVTANQYCSYLNVVAAGDNYLLFYNEKMGSDSNVASIKRAVVNGKNQYSVIQDKQGDRGDFPIVYVNLYQAARFCNWLQNQNIPGLTVDELTENGAYTLKGKSSGPIARNPEAIWFIPTESEWYKPAYYKGGGLKEGYWHFANRSDWAPSDSLNGGENSANYCSLGYTKQGPPYLTPVDYFKQSVGTYNTYDMSGNAAEWVATEEKQGASPLKYIARGGSWKSLYYGTTLGSKFNGADWGLELSKWSRPAYDPTQGYDNISFRVATSLIVNSAPPDKAAPGAGELTPTQTVEVPFIALAGVAAFFPGKKINDCHRNAEITRVTQENRREEERKSTTENFRGDQVSLMTPPASPTNSLIITEKQKEEMELLIRPLKDLLIDFEKKKEEDQKIINQTIVAIKKRTKEKCVFNKILSRVLTGLPEEAPIELSKEVYEKLKKKAYLEVIQETSIERLKKTKEMSDALDDYATAFAKAADKIKENLLERYDIWLPWYAVAMDLSGEAMLSRHCGIKQFYHEYIFPQEERSFYEKKASRLRNDSNQKTLEYIAIVKNYKEALQALINDQENSSNNSLTKKVLEKVKTEDLLLQDIESKIKENEDEAKPFVKAQAKAVNKAYLAYKKAKKEENKDLINTLKLTCLNNQSKCKVNNFISSIKLREEFQSLLNEPVLEDFYSPGPPPDSIDNKNKQKGNIFESSLSEEMKDDNTKSQQSEDSDDEYQACSIT